MQDRPDANILLEAIQDFLIKEVMPEVRGNDLLSYKTLVSWNMLGVISREFKSGEALLNKEIGRLVGFFQDDKISGAANTYQEKLQLCRQLNENLSQEIRQKKISVENREVWNLVRDSVKEKLEISNPRYSSPD
ncbi:MAG: DUF6285 domain-containing protein [Leptospira sp.]|nr:DUF6285 domain-containing protein [Leptospira sp.]